MRVVSWNVAGVGGIKKDRIGRICGKVASVRVDVLLLQEVPVDKKPVKRLSAELGNLGLEYWVFSGRAKPGRKKYGSAIASRYPLLEAERGWADGAPFPELMARATADMEGRAVDVISVHIPNGRGNGWKKIETLEVLGGVLRSAARMPRVVGGSFNEPMRFEPERVVVPWACKEDDLGNPNWRGRKRHKKGGEHPRARWEAAVRLVLDAEPWTGLPRPRTSHRATGRSRAATTTCWWEDSSSIPSATTRIGWHPSSVTMRPRGRRRSTGSSDARTATLARSHARAAARRSPRLVTAKQAVPRTVAGPRGPRNRSATAPLHPSR
jgi:hypothetical protein